MRWKSWNMAHRGEKREWSGFLWFPLCINGNVRWLERAKVLYEVELDSELDYDGRTIIGRWVPTRFLD